MWLSGIRLQGEAINNLKNERKHRDSSLTENKRIAECSVKFRVRINLETKPGLLKRRITSSLPQKLKASPL